MLVKRDATAIEIEEVSETDQLAALDREARRQLNMTGQEFAERWRRGEFSNNPDPQITQIAMLLPDAW